MSSIFRNRRQSTPLFSGSPIKASRPSSQREKSYTRSEEAPPAQCTIQISLSVCPSSKSPFCWSLYLLDQPVRQMPNWQLWVERGAMDPPPSSPALPRQHCQIERWRLQKKEINLPARRTERYDVLHIPPSMYSPSPIQYHYYYVLSTLRFAVRPTALYIIRFLGTNARLIKTERNL